MEKKLPTIKQIAKQLNISISTVSRALHDHPNIGLRTRMRVQELARQLQYEPNQTAIFFQQGNLSTNLSKFVDGSDRFTTSNLS